MFHFPFFCRCNILEKSSGAVRVNSGFEEFDGGAYHLSVLYLYYIYDVYSKSSPKRNPKANEFPVNVKKSSLNGVLSFIFGA